MSELVDTSALILGTRDERVRPWLIDAVARMIVSPCFHNTDPAGVLVKPRVMLMGRNCWLFRPSVRWGISRAHIKTPLERFPWTPSKV